LQIISNEHAANDKAARAATVRFRIDDLPEQSAPKRNQGGRTSSLSQGGELVIENSANQERGGVISSPSAPFRQGAPRGSKTP